MFHFFVATSFLKVASDFFLHKLHIFYLRTVCQIRQVITDAVAGMLLVGTSSVKKIPAFLVYSLIDCTNLSFTVPQT